LLLPAALPRAAVPFVVLLRTDFGENATRGQAIPVTTFDANAFILLANDAMPAALPESGASSYPDVLRGRHMSRMTRRANPPIALTIAGSDSGGGAGIQADLRTFAAHGVHGLCAITAVTAQNTRAVTAIEPLKPGMVCAQLDAVFSDFDVKAIKIGMLATAAIVRTVAAALARRPSIPVVLDPVLVATTGARLARGDLAGPIRRHLIARADLVTPNIPEAETLLGRKIRTARDLPHAAADLIALGARAVLLKGGHLRGSRVTDLLLTSEGLQCEFRHARIRAEGHGTGCTLSSAIAARLALGDEIENAVGTAIDYVHRALANGYRPGRGRVRVLEHPAMKR
jgi:hydroxymethylpyrimidine/phosphomethylpyrimidine kinase